MESSQNKTLQQCYLGGKDRYTLIYAAFNGAVFVVGLFGNMLVILSVVKFKTLRTTTNLFVVSLSIADLLVCVCIPYYVSFYFDVPYGCQKYPCLIRYATALYATIVSVLSLVGVAVDRYLAVVYALQYHQLMCRQWVWISIVGIYVYVAIIIFPIFRVNTWSPTIPECDLVYIVSCGYALYVVGLHVLVTVLLTFILYVRIFRAAWRQVRMVASQELHSRIYLETRTALIMVFVLGVYFLSLAPFLFVVVMRYTVHADATAQQDTLSKAKKFVMCLYFGKSCLNPLIYGWKNRDFRGAFKKLLTHRFRCFRRE